MNNPELDLPQSVKDKRGRSRRLRNLEMINAWSTMLGAVY